MKGDEREREVDEEGPASLLRQLPYFGARGITSAVGLFGGA